MKTEMIENLQYIFQIYGNIKQQNLQIDAS